MCQLDLAIVAYLTATLIEAFAPPTAIEAIQILPDSSWSATVRNLESMRFHIHIKQAESMIIHMDYDSSMTLSAIQIMLTWLFLNQSQR